MERSYLNTIIGLMAVILFGAFVIFKPNNSADFDQKIQEIFTVNMPRPVKEFFASFSLDDRNVIRIVENSDSAKKPKLADKKADPKKATQAAVDKKMTEAEKKRNDEYRRQYLQKQAQQREFRIRVVQESERYRRELLRKELENLSNLENSLDQANGFAARKNANLNADNSQTNNDEEKEDSLTADQWKSLILSQPTRENAALFAEAFQKGEVDLASYNEVAELLMKDNAENKKTLGAWILTAATSLESFKLANQYKSRISAEGQTILSEYIYNYARPQALPVLEQVLRSVETELKTVAADVISKGVEKLKSANTANNQPVRINRGNSNQSLSNYRRLVPTLQWLVSNPSSGLTQWAQGMLSQLQTSITPA